MLQLAACKAVTAYCMKFAITCKAHQFWAIWEANTVVISTSARVVCLAEFANAVCNNWAKREGQQQLQAALKAISQQTLDQRRADLLQFIVERSNKL